jgi:hypothetical protein
MIERDQVDAWCEAHPEAALAEAISMSIGCVLVPIIVSALFSIIACPALFHATCTPMRPGHRAGTCAATRAAAHGARQIGLDGATAYFDTPSMEPVWKVLWGVP